MNGRPLDIGPSVKAVSTSSGVSHFTISHLRCS